MSNSFLSRPVTRALSGLLLAALLSTAFQATAQSATPPGWYNAEPGWYVGAGGFHHGLDDARSVSQIPGTLGTPASNNCLLADLLGLGTLLDAIGGIGNEGCLLGLLGPGNDQIDPTLPQSIPTLIEYDGGIGLTASAGYLFDGGLRPELALSYARADWDRITLGTGATPLTTRSNNSTTAFGLFANLWYDFELSARFAPYLGGGLGYQQLEVSGDINSSDHGLAYQLGAGVSIPIDRQMRVGLDYRYQVQDDPSFSTSDGGRLESEYKAHQIGVSARYYFGGGDIRDADGDGVPDRLDRCPNTPADVQVDRFGCPLDSDGDGIPDHQDQCPNTPPGVPVDTAGCPLDSDSDGVPDHLDQCPNTPPGTQVDARGCPLDLRDSDGDGVPDLFDTCPDTPPGVATGEDGCPLDSDGDGIPDYLDECPNTPPGLAVLPDGCALVGDCRRPKPGEAVDENGCAVNKAFILHGVKFEFDSAILTPEAKQILDRVAETLKAYPNVNRVELGGHTDHVGTAAYNLGLSERRAIAVKDYLGDRGIAKRRLTPVGYGLSQPIADNATEAGREENRRVELMVRE